MGVGREKRMPPGWAAFEGPNSALGELGGAAGGLQAVLLGLQNPQSIALQWIGGFENQFPFKMNPVNFYHIV